LPTWLYILLALTSFLFKLSIGISGSTGSIFTIFDHIEGIYVSVVDPEQFFRLLKGRCHGKKNWGKIGETTFIQNTLSSATLAS